MLVLEKLNRLQTIIVSLLFCQSCAHSAFKTKSRFDSRKTSLQSILLYSETLSHESTKNDYSQDQEGWVLRRERLKIIDSELRENQPDIVAFQGLVSREFSPYDSDLYILSSGSLQGYKWQRFSTGDNDERNEIDSTAIAVGLPKNFTHLEMRKRKIWNFGDKGFLAAFVILVEGIPTPIYIINLNQSELDKKFFLKTTSALIEKYIKKYQLCAKRMIVFANISVDEDIKAYEDVLNHLQLKDSSQGLCSVSLNCATSDPENNFNFMLFGDHKPERNNRILLHKETIVYSSKRNLDKKRESNVLKLLNKDGEGSIYPSPYYGWLTTMRLPICVP